MAIIVQQTGSRVPSETGADRPKTTNGPALPLEILDRVAHMLVEHDPTLGPTLEVDDPIPPKDLLACAAVNKAFRSIISPALWKYCNINSKSSARFTQWLASCLPANIQHTRDVCILVFKVADACRMLGQLREVDFADRETRLRVDILDDREGPQAAHPLLSALQALRSFPKALAIELETEILHLGFDAYFLRDRTNIVVLSLVNVDFVGRLTTRDRWMDTLADIPTLAALQLEIRDMGRSFTQRTPRFAALRFVAIEHYTTPEQGSLLIREILARSAATLEGFNWAGPSTVQAWDDLRNALQLNYLMLVIPLAEKEVLLDICAAYIIPRLPMMDDEGRHFLPYLAHQLATRPTMCPQLREVHMAKRHWPAGMTREDFGRPGLTLWDYDQCSVVMTLLYFDFLLRHFAKYHEPEESYDFWLGDMLMADFNA